MKNKKTLIIYYSRSGITGRVAHALQRETSGELVEITTKSYPSGIMGYLAAGLDATLGRAVPIGSIKTSLTSYDLILIGTPVWGSSLAPPVRTFLSQPLPHARKVAFFLTHGGSGASRVFGQMEELCGRHPSSTLALTESDVRHRKYSEKVREFTRSLERLAPSEAA